MNEVADYYNQNTNAFLRFGHGGEVYAIHRAVWGPGVETRTAAMQYVDKLIAGTVGKYEIQRAVDLGCGCGGSMAFIAGCCGGVPVYGITLSEVQYDIGRRYLGQRGIGENIFLGSYLDRDFYTSVGLPRKAQAGPVLFYAVESYLHCPDRERYFSLLKEVSLPGDILIICDDFLHRPPEGRRMKRLHRDFVRGWRAVNLEFHGDVLKLAGDHSFIALENTDLTGMLELNRVRDIFIRLTVPFVRLFGGKSPFAGNLIGGNALQVLLLKGILRYRFIVFQRVP